MTSQQKQCLLCYLGHYDGAIDGIWGPKSAKGEALFRQSRGLSPTDPLEPALLDAICNPSADWWDSPANAARFVTVTLPNRTEPWWKLPNLFEITSTPPLSFPAVCAVLSTTKMWAACRTADIYPAKPWISA